MAGEITVVMETKRGLQQVGQGSRNPLRCNQDGSLVVVPQATKYEEDVRAGRCFVVSNQAAVAITAGLNTTYTGLAIGNPASSNVDVVILRFGYTSAIAVPTATAVGIMTGSGALATAALVPRNCFVGGASSVAKASAGDTIATPVLERVYGNAGTLAVTGMNINAPQDVDLDGSIVLAPGTFAAAFSSAANTAAFFFYFMWKEVPRF